MDTLVGGTRWEYPLGPGNPPAVQAEYLPLRDHLGSTVMLMRAEYTTDLGQFYGVFAEPEPPPVGQSFIEPENAGFGLKVAEMFDYDPYGWPTVHAPSGSPAKFGDPVVGLLAIRSGQVGALEGSVTNCPLLSGRELWQWYTNEPGNDPMLVESETTRAPHASTGWRHLYTGRPWDAQTRSYYYRHRWYDPHQARFLSRDPIGYDDGLLQYAYVGGDPIGRVDPLGLEWWNPWTWGDPDPVDWGDGMPERARACYEPRRRNSVGGGFLDGAADGYIGWSCGYMDWIGGPFFDDHTDWSNSSQSFGRNMGTISAGASYAAVILAGTGVGAGATFRVATSARPLPVTSWAPKGVTPDLSSGRWVMWGRATWGNHVLTGTRYPFSNSISGTATGATTKLPPRLQSLKWLLGQAVLK